MAIVESTVYAISDTVVVKRENGVWSSIGANPTSSYGISLAADGSGALFLVSNTNLYEWSGTAWTNLGTLLHGTGRGIHALNEDEVWLSGSATWITRWRRSGGFTHWQEGTGSPFWEPRSVFAWTDQLVILGGRSSSSRSWVYRTTNGGSTWTRVVDTTGGGAYALFTLDGTDWWLGNGPNLYYSNNGGASFSLLGTMGSGNVQSIWGTGPSDIWIATGGNGSDPVIGHWNGSSFDNIQTWNDVGYSGVSCVVGLNTEEVYWQRRLTGNAVKWNGTIFSQEGTGAGSFPYWGPNGMAAYTRALHRKIQPEQVHGERKVEEEFIASQAGTEQFTLASDATPTTKQPSGWMVQVYVGGIEHEYNAAPAARQFRVDSSTTVTVGGLVIGAEVEIVYGVA